MRQVMVQGLDKDDQLLTLTMAAYNLTRKRTLAQLRPQCERSAISDQRSAMSDER